MSVIYYDNIQYSDENYCDPDYPFEAYLRFKELDIILLGDFNADCRYFNEASYSSVFSSGEYIWIISNNEDTTVSKTDCTYDRIVTTLAVNEDYAGKNDVYRFDTVYGFDRKQAKKVSDHYPVWAEFYVGRDSE